MLEINGTEVPVINSGTGSWLSEYSAWRMELAGSGTREEDTLTLRVFRNVNNPYSESKPDWQQIGGERFWRVL